MINSDSPSPSSNQPSAPDREDPDCPAIVAQSMPVAPESAGVIDDKQWTRIVVESLSTRSPEAREALLQALQNDQPARSTGSSSSMAADLDIGEPGVSRDAVQHDQTQASVETSSRTVPPILPLRSNASARASGKDHHNGQRAVRRGSMPLLGLELPITENSGQNPFPSEDSNHSTPLAPLLGTNIAEIAEKLRKSSTGRSPKCVCYGNLLRQDGPQWPGKPQITAVPAELDCYGNLLRNLPKGVFRRSVRRQII